MQRYTTTGIALRTDGGDYVYVRESDALAAIEQARREAFEEAAKLAFGHSKAGHHAAAGRAIAAAIRARGEGK